MRPKGNKTGRQPSSPEGFFISAFVADLTLLAGRLTNPAKPRPSSPRRASPLGSSTCRGGDSNDIIFSRAAGTLLHDDRRLPARPVRGGRYRRGSGEAFRVQR